MFMCLACSEIYDNYFDVCPKAHCNGGIDGGNDIIYVDDTFAPVLAEFNKKGYQIEDASFGNPNNSLSDNPYIMFSDYFYDVLGEDETAELFINLPEPWRFKIDCGHPVIYCYVFGKNSMERFKELLEAHMQLMYFVENLDELYV